MFVDGEFWYGKHFGKWRSTVSAFWLKKISENIKRDRIVNRKLKENGWKVIRIWGKDIIKNPMGAKKRLVL